MGGRRERGKEGKRERGREGERERGREEKRKEERGKEGLGPLRSWARRGKRESAPGSSSTTSASALARISPMIARSGTPHEPPPLYPSGLKSAALHLTRVRNFPWVSRVSSGAIPREFSPLPLATRKRHAEPTHIPLPFSSGALARGSPAPGLIFQAHAKLPWIRAATSRASN